MAAFKREEGAFESELGVLMRKRLALESELRELHEAYPRGRHSFLTAELELPEQEIRLSHTAPPSWFGYKRWIVEARGRGTPPAKPFIGCRRPRKRSGSADHMQIFSDYGALWQPRRRSSAEYMQILKNRCNRYNELSSKESISKPGSLFAPRNPGYSKGCNSGQKREEDLMTTFAPILRQRLHDALEPILGPVACGFRSQGEEVRKERERLLALEKQKLALNLKDLERLKRRRAGRFQRSRRASSAFPRRRRQGQGHRLRFPWKPST